MSTPDPALLELLDQLGLDRSDVADLLAATREMVAADVAEAISSPIPTVAFDELHAVSDTTRARVRCRGAIAAQAGSSDTKRA